MVTPFIMFLIWEVTEVTQVLCFLLLIQIWSLSFLILLFSSETFWTEKGTCLKDLVMAPLFPLTVISLALKSTSTKHIWEISDKDKSTSFRDLKLFFSENVFHCWVSLKLNFFLRFIKNKGWAYIFNHKKSRGKQSEIQLNYLCWSSEIFLRQFSSSEPTNSSLKLIKGKLRTSWPRLCIIFPFTTTILMENFKLVE